MFKNLDGNEVLKLMSHLVITILLIMAYVYLTITKQNPAELGTLLSLAVGYWFGAVGISGLKSSSGGTVSQNADNQNKGA